jgi:hypothetical protein
VQRALEFAINARQLSETAMDLNQVVTISPRPGHMEWHEEKLSLFEAIRRWADSEDDPFEIHLNGTVLTGEQVHQILGSKLYLDMLLAFEERR